MNKFVVVASEKKVNQETGEITYLDTIERRPQELINVWDPRRKIQRTKHIKRRSSIEARKLMLELTLNERAFLFAVEPYLQWETNVLIGDGVTAGKKDQPLLWKDIDKLTRMERHTRKATVELLVEKNLVGYLESQHKRKGIVINPDLMLNGRLPSESLRNVFFSSHDLDADDKKEEEKEIESGRNPTSIEPESGGKPTTFKTPQNAGYIED